MTAPDQGPYAYQDPQPQGATDGAARPGFIGPYKLANFGWRLLAWLVDAIPTIIVLVIFRSIGHTTSTKTVDCTRDGVPALCTQITTKASLLWVGGLIVLIYAIWDYVYLQGRTGQTIGKKVTGLQLARPMYLEGRGNTFVVPGMGLALGRQLLHILDGIPFYAGYWLAMPISKRRQTFADMIVGSVVLGPKANNGQLFPLEHGSGVRA